MAVASTVTVDITAKTAKFENGLKRAKKTAGGFGKAIQSSMRLAGAAAAGLAVGLAALTKRSLETVDAQRKAARTLGTTQRVFAGLSLAAEISGVSVQSFEKALKKQQKAIVDANDGLLTQQRAFDRLGLSAKDLINLPVEEQFKQITTALGEVENATLKVGIASDIFGAKNTDLINVLELGEAGLDSFINKVDELGVALTDNQTAAIEEANDAILVMKTAFVGLGNQLAARLAPAITAAAGVIEDMTQSVTESIPKWAAWAAEIFGVQRELANLALADINAEIPLITKNLQLESVALQNILVKRKAALEAGKDTELFDNLLNKINGRIVEMSKRLQELKKARDDLNLSGEIATPESGDVTADQGIITPEALKRQAQFDAALKATRTPLEALQMKLADIRSDLASNPLWTADLAGRQSQAAVDAYIAQLDRVADAAQAVVDQQQNAFERATKEVATPLETLQSKLAEIRADLEQNPFWTPELAARQSKDAVDAYIEQLDKIEEAGIDVFANLNEFQLQAARNAQDIFAEFLFDPFNVGVDGMLKAFVDMLRKMVAQLIASKLLTSFLSLFPGLSSAGSIVGGAAGGGSTGPPARHGGIRSGGQSVLVGEGGPELFTPGATGAIRPIGAINFQSTTNIGDGGGGIDIATLIPILEQNNRKVKGELLDEIDRGANG